jgi:hypothetical protein
MAALATLDDLEAVTGAPIDDATRAERLLEMAGAAVARWCRRTLVGVSHDEIAVQVVDGAMWLPNAPVTEVSEILGPDGATIAQAGYEVTLRGEIVRAWGHWAPGKYSVTYTHGYDPIPPDIALAVCQMVSRVLAGTTDGVSRETIGEATVEYTPAWSGGLALTDDERALLAPYRLSLGSREMRR